MTKIRTIKIGRDQRRNKGVMETSEEQWKKKKKEEKW